MKQFLKFTLATIVGVILASILSSLIFIGIISAFSSSSEEVVEVSENSVYQLDLKGTLIDRSEEDPFSAAFSEAFGQEEQQVIGLDDVLANIKKAKDNENIKGIYLHGGELLGGYASMKEIRDALVDFKKSG